MFIKILFIMNMKFQIDKMALYFQLVFILNMEQNVK